MFDFSISYKCSQCAKRKRVLTNRTGKYKCMVVCLAFKRKKILPYTELRPDWCPINELRQEAFMEAVAMGGLTNVPNCV